MQPLFDYESKKTYQAEFDGFRTMFLTLGGALSLIIGLVGVLNFLNAVLTGILTRRHEFAVLQAIGIYTLGRSGHEANMLVNNAQLQAIGATFYHIDRGGDITYHGPGQVVCYPIINLEEFALGLRDYVHLLEEAVIQTCKLYGIEAGRLEKATGVWLDGHSARARKICVCLLRIS